MRKTKIVCTLGPASNEETIIEQLILAGMDAARFNFSHGTHETHLAQLTRFKHVRDSLGRPVATIQGSGNPNPHLWLRHHHAQGGTDFCPLYRRGGGYPRAGICYL